MIVFMLSLLDYIKYSLAMIAKILGKIGPRLIYSLSSMNRG